MKSLQEIYGHDDMEASNLFKISLDSINLYNTKLRTMEKTKDLIKDNMREDDFNNWSKQYQIRKPMCLQVITVSIWHFLKTFFSFKIKHCTEYYQTFSNNFFSENFQTDRNTTKEDVQV